MSGDLVWIQEGSVLDDAGNLIVTTYVDLREEGKRTPIPALVKGCRQEHALEDGETLLVSQPARFREYGEGLIQDEQEGLAREESVSVVEETAAQAARRREIADMNEAHGLLGSRIRRTRKKIYSSKGTKSRHLAHGKECWIFCTSIMPEDDDRESWKATLDKEYDHVSVIGQPAKFAEALARMVTEQIGPQGKDGWREDTTEGVEGARTKHRTQWVIHGPVVYADRLYETVTRDCDDRTRFAAPLFTKDSKYADQQEYRFVVLNEGADAETVLLNSSGMMRDALKPMERGLVRAAPAQATESVGEFAVRSSSRTSRSERPLHERSSTKERRREWEETRLETRGPDGKVLSSDSKRRGSETERIVTRDHEPNDEDVVIATGKDMDDDGASLEHPVPELAQGPESRSRELSDDEISKELVRSEGGRTDADRGDGDGTAMAASVTGRAYKSFEEMIEDPGFPVSPSAETWQESACSPVENARAYGFLTNLAFKVTRVKAENRRDAASASWHAVQCIRNIYARLGDIVDTVGIERERFVMIRLKMSGEHGAVGRIVISPSGSYDYCFQLEDTEQSGHGEVALGVMFFPMENDTEAFEKFGWPSKAR